MKTRTDRKRRCKSLGTERPRLFARLSDASGNLLEAAIVTPLLLLLTFSIIDFASVFYVYLALENGVSQATRYGITGNQMNDPAGVPLGREQSMKIAMRDATPTLTIEDSAFTFSHLPVGQSTWVGGAGGPDDISKVSVSYTWTIFTPVIRPFFDNGQVNLTVESAMKNERRFD
jgi:TadE-like protein